MTSKKNWGSTVMGWFVVKEDGEISTEPSSTDTGLPDMPSAGGADDADAIIARAAGLPSRGTSPGPSSPGPPAPVKPTPAAPGGQVDFPKVFEAFGNDAEEQSRVDRAKQLLASLPAETDAALKKTIVEASLKAFGIPTDKIIEAAAEQIQALEGYIRAGAADTTKVLEEAQKRIADFEEEIRRIKDVMEQRIHEQNAVTRACNDKKLEVQKVLEFFGQEAVAKVVKESPRLVEPETPTGARPKGRT
ncbi:MAG: hypothetical protein JNK60_06500 [Acidobacteria bacterium]|nr:hypothetical protein [Acidobacteriota bacterium]